MVKQIYEKDEKKNIRISFQLVNSLLYRGEHYKDEVSNHICQASCDKCIKTNHR